MRGYQASFGPMIRASWSWRLVFCAAIVLTGVYSAAADDPPPPEPIGRGDGRIHIIPTLSAPSVKNGGKLTISAVVKAAAGVREVRAEIRDGERVIDTLELDPAPRNMGGVGELGLAGSAGGPPAALAGPPTPDPVKISPDSAPSSFTLPPSSFPQVGLWTADWIAHGLEEKNYTIRLRVTDFSAHQFEDDWLQFSEPVAGVTTPGTTNYPSAGLRRTGGLLLDNDSNLSCAVFDNTNGYGYFGTSTSPEIVVKVDFNGAGIPTRVGALTLNLYEDYIRCAAIDPAAGYAYFGTSTAPGRVVKVALNGVENPTRVGALTLNAGEDGLGSAVIDPAAGYAYFGTSTAPGRIVNFLPSNANLSKSRDVSLLGAP